MINDLQININNKSTKKIISDMKNILIEAFPNSYSKCTTKDIKEFFNKDRILILAYDKKVLVGIVGAINQYKDTGWELHPLVINQKYQKIGIGTLLLKNIEDEVLKRGGIMIYLGSDDDNNKTSLSGNDLYINTYEKIINIENYHNHPYEFYQKNGYKIVGVFPDANGIGKPDIWLAKTIKK